MSSNSGNDNDVKARAKEVNGELLTDNFFGGKGKADGDGHGHVVVNESGDVKYAREAAQNLPGTTRADRVSVNKK